MDEHADADEQVVRFVGGDRAVFDTICHGHGDATLGRAEHLHGLLGALDRDLVEHHGRRLGGEVGRHHREQRGETVLVVGQRVGERRFGGGAAGADEQVDVGNFVAVTDQRFTDKHAVDFCHSLGLHRWWKND